MPIMNPDGTWTNERTGDTFATRDLAVAIDGDDTAYMNGTGVAVVTNPIPALNAYDNAGNKITTAVDTRARDIYGNLVTNQQNDNQYWLNAGYTGADPTFTEQKAADDAMVAYNNAVGIAQAAASKYGLSGVSAEIASLVNSNQVQTASGTNPGYGAATATLPDIGSILSPYIEWIENNILWVVVIVVAIWILPSVIPHGRRA